jgi:hypothetical protein
MKLCPKQNISTEYKSGLPIQRTVEYQAVLELIEHLDNLEIAEVNIRNHPEFATAEELRIRYESKNAANQMLFTIEATFVDFSKRLTTPQLEIVSTLEQTETIFAANGELITVTYIPDGTPENAVTQVVPVTITRPRVEIRVRVLEDFFPIIESLPRQESPALHVMNLWLNKINATQWRGMNPHTVLCTAVTMQPFYINLEIPQVIYETAFAFIFDPMTHDKFVYFKDANGDIPTNVYWTLAQSNGIKLWQVYQEAEFNALFPLAGKPF